MMTPEANYGAILEDMVKGRTLLNNHLAASRIEEDHPLRGQAAEIYRKVDRLRVKMGVPHIPDDKSSVKKSSSGYKRAPLHVPTFSGDVKDWHTFWAAFKIAIHTATDLDPEIKLSYLKAAMKDKSLQRTLARFTDGPEAYGLAVRELESRFDKPKLMHRLYLRNITSLSQSKATQAELTSLADTIQESFDGLRRLGQTDLESILTSLTSEFLPDKVRLAWEDSTEDSKAVAPISELLEFIRKKADNPLYMEKSRGGGHQGSGHPEKKSAHVVKAKGAAHLINSNQSAPSAPPPSSSSAGQQHSGGGRNSAQPIIRYSCPLCQDLHYCFSCPSFRKLSVQRRKIM